MPLLKLTGYKVNLQELVVLLYTSNSQKEKFKKKSPLQWHQNNKILRDKLSLRGEKICTVKVIRWWWNWRRHKEVEKYPLFLDRKKFNIVKMSSLPKLIYNQRDSYQNSNGLFHKIEKKTNNLKFNSTHQRYELQKQFEKENKKAGGIALPDFKLIV